MISLYDYLGAAAGNELGKQVAEYAKIRKAKFGTREVSNSAYKGIVHLYEESFIKEFFKVSNLFKGNDYVDVNNQLEKNSFRLKEK